MGGCASFCASTLKAFPLVVCCREKAVAAGLPAHAILAPMLIQSGSYRGVTRGLAMLEEGAEKGSARCLQTLGEIHFSGLHAAGLLWNVTIPPDMYDLGDFVVFYLFLFSLIGCL